MAARARGAAQVCERSGVWAFMSDYWYASRPAWLLYSVLCAGAWCVLYTLTRRRGWKSVFVFLALVLVVIVLVVVLLLFLLRCRSRRPIAPSRVGQLRTVIDRSRRPGSPGEEEEGGGGRRR